MAFLQYCENWIAARFSGIVIYCKNYCRALGHACEGARKYYSMRECDIRIKQLEALMEELTFRGYGQLAFLRSARGTYRIEKIELHRITATWDCAEDLARLARLCANLQRRQTMTEEQRKNIYELLCLIAKAQNLSEEILEVVGDLQEWTTEALFDRAQF